MFATLKNTQQGDDTCCLETITTPFFKRREGKLAKVACITCRTSKLKCSGDPQGCIRCRSKKIKCSYPSASVAKGNGQKKASSALPSPSPSPSTGDLPSGVQSTAAVDHIAGVVDSAVATDMPDGLNTDVGLSDDLNFDIDMSAYLALDPGQQESQLQLEPFDDAYQMVWDESIEQDASVPVTGLTTTAAQAQAQLTPASVVVSCSCFAQAGNALEAMEVAIWCQKQPRNDVKDTLQQQKKSLNDCEELLGCESCKTTPAFLMLLLSICVKIIVSMDHVCCPVGGSTRSSQKTSSSSASSSLSSSCNSPHGTLEEWSQLRKHNGVEEESSSRVPSRFSSSVTLNRWQQLDDDDESAVMQGLVGVRVARLERLLGTIDQLVGGRSLPAHKARLQEIWSWLNEGPLKSKSGWDQ